MKHTNKGSYKNKFVSFLNTFNTNASRLKFIGTAKFLLVYFLFLQIYDAIMSSVEIKQENPESHLPFLPPIPTFEISTISKQISLPSPHIEAQPSQDKYLLAATLLEIPDVDAYLKQMRFELRFLAEKWKNDYLIGRESNSLASELRESIEPRIEVDVDDLGKLFATIECVLCNRNIRIGFNKYKTLEGLKHRLNSGNFNAHLRNHFRE